MDSLAFRRNSHGNIISYGALYYTGGYVPDKIANWCRARLLEAIGDMPLVSVSLQPLDFGKNIALDLKPGYLTMFTQILTGLEALDTEWVFLCEDDVGYPKDHFQFDPPDERIWYDVNWYKVHPDGLVVRWRAEQVSGICAPRKVLLEWYATRVATFDPRTFDRKFEPLSGEGSAQWQAPVPHIDIRHENNLTYSKRGLHHFRKKETAINFETTNIDNIPGWNLQLSDIY